ncbi:hypothetical protein LOK49_LG10G00965 [Camellia lanceoleosa]|uniref:Uncharacterized protein n=1 Tax=Camellia lanceoleosa TaxID=1840588 RepID=A0ACC0G9X9_9ERIC|nr:hypothetical protein LOK49_LG10G00965 [Camellia lanceoleosa]
MGQSFAASVNHQNSGKLPMSPSFDNNMMGQSAASVTYQNFRKLPMSLDFDNMMRKFATSVDRQNFGTLPMSPDFDNNMMRQYATNVKDQNSRKLPTSPNFDNSLMEQFVASVNYQNFKKLPMSSGFDNMMGQSATSVNYQNSTKLLMTLGFNNNLIGQSSTASVLASNFFEEEHSKIPAKDLNSNMRLLDVDNFTLSKASLSCARSAVAIRPLHEAQHQSSHWNRAPHRNEAPTGSNCSLHEPTFTLEINSQLQIPERVAPQQTTRDNSHGVAFGGTSSGIAFRGTSSMDSSLFAVPKFLVPRAESRDVGLYRILLLCALLEKNTAQQPRC